MGLYLRRFYVTVFLQSILLLGEILSLTSVHTFVLEMSWVGAMAPLFGKYVYPTALFVQMLSIYLTVLVAVQRYACLCRPHRASLSCQRRQMTRYILGVTVLAPVSLMFRLVTERTT